MTTRSKNVPYVILVTAGILIAGCAENGPQIGATETGALAGTALGAGLGAIIGNQTGNTGAGIAIGAASGALGGALIGGQTDRQYNRINQQDERMRRQEEEIRRQQREIDEMRRGSRGDSGGSYRGERYDYPDSKSGRYDDRYDRGYDGSYDRGTGYDSGSYPDKRDRYNDRY